MFKNYFTVIIFRIVTILLCQFIKLMKLNNKMTIQQVLIKIDILSELSIVFFIRIL